MAARLQPNSASSGTISTPGRGANAGGDEQDDEGDGGDDPGVVKTREQARRARPGGWIICTDYDDAGRRGGERDRTGQADGIVRSLSFGVLAQRIGCAIVPSERVRQQFTAALDALVERSEADRSILAAMLCGSLSHDTVWAKSDIDLVAGDHRRQAGAAATWRSTPTASTSTRC